jgi:SAM-dependent methyltransferase
MDGGAGRRGVMGERAAEMRASYDRVAEEYAARMADELAHKPFDRALLDRLAVEVGGRGTICDLGCGPGQVARYLHDHGAPACGIDLSPAMVAEARRRHPGIDFAQGDIIDLAGVADGAFGGVAAFYSLIHIELEEMVAALREIERVLRPGGVLLLAFHVGEHVVHLDEWWERPVAIDFLFFTPEKMLGYLHDAGYTRCDVFERAPYEGVEAATERAYIFARREADANDCVAIRRARPDEAGRLSDLAFRSKAHWGYDDAFMEACRDELTLTQTEIATTAVYVVASGDDLLGFHQIKEFRGEAELWNLFIEPQAIGSGHGKRLWHHAATLARAWGYRALIVESDPYAEGFYRAMGMERGGEVPSGSIPGRVLPKLRIAL